MLKSDTPNFRGINLIYVGLRGQDAVELRHTYFSAKVKKILVRLVRVRNTLYQSMNLTLC